MNYIFVYILHIWILYHYPDIAISEALSSIPARCRCSRLQSRLTYIVSFPTKGRWLSPSMQASPTYKNIPPRNSTILLKVALKTNKSVKFIFQETFFILFSIEVYRQAFSNSVAVHHVGLINFNLNRLCKNIQTEKLMNKNENNTLTNSMRMCISKCCCR